jgi:ribosomal protein L11 methyltransferase
VRYIELTATVAYADAELTAAILRDITGVGASIDLPFTQRDLESDAVLRNDASASVHVYVREGDPSAAARASLGAAGIDAALTTSVVADEDWAESWKQHFHPERFGERIVVVPSWRTYEAAANDIIITLDPGMAFGTGQHETTRMCLEALERCVRPGDRVLDVGCGSGILAIAAAKLGAAQVAALDIDPDCVRITRENAALNHVLVEARQAAAGDAELFTAHASTASFDIIVANIIAATIIGLAPSLVAALAPAGRLITSGIISEREPAVVAELESRGLTIEAVHRMGDWRCIEAVRA